MASRLLFLAIGVALLPMLSGCDATSTTTDAEFVVQSYLIAAEPLPPVRVLRSIPVDQTYDAEEAAVEGATVTVLRLDGEGQVHASYPYEEGRPGVYRPVASGNDVAPGTRYRLEVQPPDGSAPIHATTAVPEAFEVVRVENQEAVYQAEDAQPSITITQRDTAGEQHILFTIESLLDFENTPEEELRDALTPFYADVIDAEDDPVEELRVSSSTIVNESYFDRNADGTLTVELPWIGVAFYGPNRAAINVMDKNLYDLVRTQEIQQGGLSPGEIPNVIEHVEGGAGIFGSYARQTVEVCVRRDSADAAACARTERF